MGGQKDHYDDLEQFIDLKLSQQSYMKTSSGYFTPATDIYETDDELIVYVEIAGMKKENIDLSFQKGELIISGNRHHVCPACMKTVHRLEIDHGRFLRMIELGDNIIKENILAEYRDGILEIKIPKRG